MRFFGESKKKLVELWIVSIIAGLYFSAVSNGGLCMMLLGGDGTKYRCVLAVILMGILWCVAVCLRLTIDRIGELHSVRDMIYSLLDTKAVVFFYYLALFRLNEAAFYPFYIGDKVYFVSYFLFGAYLAVAFFSYVVDHKKFWKMVMTSTVLCFMGWCFGRILPKRHVSYNAFYYCQLLINIIVVFWTVWKKTPQHCLEKIQNWILPQKCDIAICLLAGVFGCCIEIINAYCHGVQILVPRCIFWAAIAACLASGIILYRKKQFFSERFYLCIILTVGIYMAIFMPLTTGISWDDQIHYTQALSIIQGNHSTNADWSMAVIERGHPEEAIALVEEIAYYESLLLKATELSTMTLNSEHVAGLQKLGYIPNGIGLCIGQVLKLPYGITFILGRMSGVIFYALVIYAAMKKVSSGKLILAVVALIPTNLFQAANYTYDAWIVCLVIYALAIFVEFFRDREEQLTLREILIPMCIMAIAIAPKGVYFPLLLLFMMIPRSCFVDREQYRKHIFASLGLVALCFLVYMLLPFLGGKNQGDVRVNADVSSIGQIRYILTNPLLYAKDLFIFLKTYLSFENIWSYTCFFAYLNNTVDYSGTILMLLIAASLVDRTKRDLVYDTAKVKSGAALILYFTAALVVTVMYMVCSPVGGEIGVGIQPRYLAPMVYPFLLLVCNFGCLKNENKNHLPAAVLSVSAYCLLNVVWVNLVSRFVVL